MPSLVPTHLLGRGWVWLLRGTKLPWPIYRMTSQGPVNPRREIPLDAWGIFHGHGTSAFRTFRTHSRSQRMRGRSCSIPTRTVVRLPSRTLYRPGSGHSVGTKSHRHHRQFSRSGRPRKVMPLRSLIVNSSSPCALVGVVREIQMQG